MKIWSANNDHTSSSLSTEFSPIGLEYPTRGGE